MGIEKVSTHDVPEAGTVLAALGDGDLELVLAPQDAGRNVAFLVSGIYGTGVWQIMDLENLVPGAEIKIETSMNGALLQSRTFVGRPIEVTNLPEGVEPAADIDTVAVPVMPGGAPAENPSPAHPVVPPPPPLD